MNAVLSTNKLAHSVSPDLRVLARAQPDPVGWAVLGTCWSGMVRHMAPDVLVRGLDRDEVLAVVAHYGGSQALSVVVRHTGETHPAPYDEFADVLSLLMRHRVDGSDRVRWLAHALATASMYENHLWQDLHLPSRAVLSELIAWGFPELAARNIGPMKWKKFFYKQLCDAAEFASCKSPTCGACSDYSICFGSEDAAPLR